MKKRRLGRATLLLCCCALVSATIQIAEAEITTIPQRGLASWYGERNRGRPMAKGRKFDPDKLTAASWFYPLGTRVRVTAKSRTAPERSVLVTITDRGPSDDLVRS